MKDASHTTTHRKWQGASCEGPPQVISFHVWHASTEPVLACLRIQVHVACTWCQAWSLSAESGALLE